MKHFSKKKKKPGENSIYLSIYVGYLSMKAKDWAAFPLQQLTSVKEGWDALAWNGDQLTMHLVCE